MFNVSFQISQDFNAPLLLWFPQAGTTRAPTATNSTPAPLYSHPSNFQQQEVL